MFIGNSPDLKHDGTKIIGKISMAKMILCFAVVDGLITRTKAPLLKSQKRVSKCHKV